MKTEKIEGRLEAIDDMRAVTDEKISRLSEEIGELRSALLERERTFNQIESGFARIKDTVEEIKPEKLAKAMKKIEDDIVNSQAKTESLELKMNETKKSVETVKDILDKVKSFENLAIAFDNIEKKMKLIEEDKKYTTRTAGKIESMFSEMTDKIRELQSYREKIDFNEEMMHEVMKSIDAVDIKLEKLAGKDEMKRIDDKMESIKKEHEDRINEIKDVVKKLVISLKKKGIAKIPVGEDKTVETVDYASKEDLKMIKDRLMTIEQVVKEKKEAKEIMKKTPETHELLYETKPKTTEYQEAEKTQKQIQKFRMPEDEFDHVVYDAEENVRKGNINAARTLYEKALVLYNKLEQGKSMEDANRMYSKIKELYNMLQRAK
jgi:tetratricopeptide (TPR) repeat protein